MRKKIRVNRFMPTAFILTGLSMGTLPGGCKSQISQDRNIHQPSSQTAATAPAASPTQHDEHDELLPNLHLAYDRVYSGGLPAGEQAFDELKDMGIRTIICVDGGAPDVAAAESRGMRYVHIPLKYAGITPDQEAELARAVRDLPRPIYIHCHHGKHRSPAAAAVAGIGTGEISAEDGTAFLKTAGTGANYAGLWTCVRTAHPFDAARLDAAPGEFPAVSTIPAVTQLMVEIDEAFVRLQLAQKMGFLEPSIDGVASVSDAAQIADHLRAIWQEEQSKDPADRVGGSGPDSLGVWCKDAGDKAQALEDALAIDDPARQPSLQTLDAAFKSVAGSCTSCHATYRN